MASQNKALAQYAKITRTLKLITAASLVISIIAITVALYAIFNLGQATHITNSTNGSKSTNTIDFGATLAGINQPLNSSSLAVIDDANTSYFETAGQMLLNGSIDNVVSLGANNVTAYVSGGKPSVIYLGSITCVWCGENRWAMALALSRFGTFSSLYIGYSAIGDSDVPTLYWNTDSLNATGVTLGNHYSSSIINFYTYEDTAPITGGFVMQSPAVIQGEVNSIGNSSYVSAYSYLMGLQGVNKTAFQGTPYTIWGDNEVNGADAIDFGNTLPSNSILPLTYSTHGQVLSQLADPNDQFAWTEYAGADVYISYVCHALNNSASICSLPAIQRIEAIKFTA